MNVRVHHVTDHTVSQYNNSTFNYISSLLPATTILSQPTGQVTPYTHPQVATSFDFPVDNYDFFPENDTFEQQASVAPPDDTRLLNAPTTSEPIVSENTVNLDVTTDYDLHETIAGPSTLSAENSVSINEDVVVEQHATVSTRAPSVDTENPIPPNEEREEEPTGRRLPGLKRRRAVEGVNVLVLTDLTKKESVRLSSTLVVANK